MTKTLSKKELQNLNNSMLGLGAPIDIDGQGYNKIDFGMMQYLASKDEITDYEAKKIATTLIKYTKTQLSSYADAIVATAKFYQDAEKQVKVVAYDSESVTLSWNFNRNISDHIKYRMNRSDYRWTKTESGNWLLKVYTSAIYSLIDTFNAEKFDTTEVDAAVELSQNIVEADITAVTKPVKAVEFKVERRKDTIDTLTITTPYNKKVVDAFHKVINAYFNKNNSSWELYIEDSAKLYDELVNANISGLDLNELAPWAEMVKGWETSYRLIDLSELNLKFQPYDFQPVDSQKLLDLRVGLNGNDMGCGKTFEMVTVGESIPMKKLVICPPSLRLNWVKEIKFVNPNADIHVIYSADEFKIVDGWNIIGYTSLDKFLNNLEAEKFQVIMIDEAHYIQAISNSGTPESKRAFAVLRLAATANYVYPITGTPKTNRNKNLFNILRVIRHPLTRGKWAFMNYGRTFCDGEKGAWGWDFSGNSNDAELNDELVPYMVRHLKKDVLPNLTKQRIVTPVQVDLREYNYEIREYLNNRSNKNSEDLARLMRARKVLAIQKAGESIDFAKNIITTGEKIVIVTCFTDVVKAIEKAFKGNVVKLVGGMTDTAKEEAINEFQTGKTQVMVMNIIAGGVGVTLTKSHIMVINDYDWTPGNLTQAEDRICRGGQTECCMIYYMCAEGADMDEVFTSTLTEKFNTINAAVDGGEGDAIDYVELLNKALERSTGIKKTRRMKDIDIEPETTIAMAVHPVVKKTDTTEYKKMSIEELESLAAKVGATCKKYEDVRIYRMRLTMAIKRQVK